MALTSALHHVSLNVHDLDRSLAFWEGTLGFRRLPRPDMGVQGVWLGVGGDDDPVQVHLIVFDPRRGDVGTTPTSINPAAGHVAFRVDDYDDTVTRLRAAGLEVLETSAARGQCWVRDPDGHVVEFIRPGGRLAGPLPGADAPG